MSRMAFLSSIGRHIERYMEYAKPGLSQSSFDRRYSQLLAFDSYLSKIGHHDIDIDEDTVNAWIHSLQPLSDSTIMTYVVSVRKLFEYLSGMGIAKCYMPHVRRVPDKYVAHYFTETELSSIYSCADDYPCGERNPLPYIKAELPMALRILESCGTRLTETLSLQMKHVDLKRGILTMVHAKKDKERIVPMSDSLTRMLEKYCMAMGLIGMPEFYIFPKKDFNSPLARHDIDNRFANILKWNSISDRARKKYGRGICPHCFRHNFTLRSFRLLESHGIHLNDAIPYLSIYLGHDSLRETEKYLCFSAEMFPDELKPFDDASCGNYPDDTIWGEIYGEVAE